MTRELQFSRRGAATGRVRSLVIFLHGYGADGQDLLGLADPLAPHLPDTVFIAPDAPERCTGNPFGFQWFPIPWLDGSSPEAAEAGLRAAAADLDAFLTARLADEGLEPEALALVGFSQGTMMSLEVAPRRAAQIAGVVGFSGRLIGPERLSAELKSRPPVLLVHGDEDPVVAPESMGKAAEGLRAAGIAVETLERPGLAHGIDGPGLQKALDFLTKVLPG